MADIYYYEEGYFDTQGYFVYTADAAAYFSDYFDSDYLEAGYWSDDQGTKFGISADLTEVVGQTVEASGSWSSAFSLSGQGYRIQEIVLTANTSAAISATAVKQVEGILSSSAAAQMTVSVNRIRSADSSLSLSASLSAQGETSITIESSQTVQASLSVDAVTNRSAQVALENLVNISLSSDITRSTTITVSSSSSISAAANTVTDTSASLSSQTSQNTLENRIRSADSTLLVLFTPSLTADAFKNHTAQLDSVSSMSATVSVIRSGATNLSAIVSASLNANYTVNSQVTASTTSTVTAQARRVSRTVTLTTTTSTIGSLTFDSGIKKFGSHSLKLTGANESHFVTALVYGSQWVALAYPTYGNSTYYAYTSSDLLTWTKNTATGLDQTPIWVTYANGYYFALASTRYLYYSTDGISWTKRDLGSGNIFRTVIYNSGTYYAVGDGSYRSSSDLVTWSSGPAYSGTAYDALFYSSSMIRVTSAGVRVANTLTRTGNFRGIATNGSIWVIVGTGGTIYSASNPSGNSASWTSRSSQTSQDLLGVHYANGEFVAWGRTGVITTSSDGVTWTVQTDPYLVPYTFLYTESQKPQYGGNNWAVFDQTYGMKRLSSAAWTAIDWTDIQDEFQPYVSVAEAPEWRSWQTIDFWIYNTGGNGIGLGVRSPGGFDNSWVLYFGAYNIGSPTGIYPLLGGNNSTSSLSPWSSAEYTTSAVIPRNDWSHVRLSRSGTSLSVYVNGSRITTATTPSPLLDTDQDLIFYPGANASVSYLDELRITSELITDPSLTSFTPPSQAFTNDQSTTLLLHFDNNYQDDSESAIRQATASLSSQATLGSDIGKIKGFTASLNLAATVSAQAVKNTEILLTATGFGSLSVTATRIKEFAQTSQSQATLSATPLTTASGSAGIVVSGQLDSTILRIRPGLIQTDAVASQLTAAAKIGDFLIASDVQATLATDAVKTTEVTANLATDLALVTTILKIRDFTVGLTSSSQLSAVAVKSVSGQAQLQSETFGSYQVVKTTDIECDTDAVASQLTAVIKTGQGLIAMDVAASLVAVTPKIAVAQASLSMTAALTSTASKNVSVLSNQSLTSSVTIEVIKAVNATSSLDSMATVSILNSRTRSSSISTDAVASQLTAAAKIGDFLIASDVQATVSVMARKTVSAEAIIASQVNQTSSVGTIKTTVCAFSNTATLSCVAQTVIAAEAAIDCAATVSAQGQKTARTTSQPSSQATVSIDGSRTRSAQADLTALAFNLTVGTRIKEFSATMASTSTASATLSKVVTASATLPVIASSLTVGRDLQLSQYPTWTIPAETRLWSIKEETRLYKIREETRLYVIKEEA